jgi:UPF0042 nucleotide-binding protein
VLQKPKRPSKKLAPEPKAVKKAAPAAELVIITGMSGSGKASVLRSLEDIGYHSVDNLPVDLIPKFAELASDSASGRRSALVVDAREGAGLKRLPGILRKLRAQLSVRLVYLDAANEALMRRFSETRRPHPLGGGDVPIAQSIEAERALLKPISALADLTIETSKFNVHELRDFIRQKFSAEGDQAKILVYVMSFGYRHGLPPDCDLVFDARFLPNPNYIPKFKQLTGRNPAVARYIRSFPQTAEFIQRISDLLIYLLPHYIREGKSYLTIGIGCTGGHHRSVMIADDIRKNIATAGFQARVSHRDIAKPV